MNKTPTHIIQQSTECGHAPTKTRTKKRTPSQEEAKTQKKNGRKRTKNGHRANSPLF